MKYTLRPLLNGPKFKILSLVCDGVCKTSDFLAEVEQNDADEFASVMAFIEHCSTYGPPRNKQKSRPVGDDVFELKTKSTRICYFYDQGQMIVCTHGFYKPQEKVQSAEIKAAKDKKEAYSKEKKKGLVSIEKENK